ncbi:gas vesicle protein [Streptomyces sp. NPDC020681]|uniref:gas vesicle protein n=1 Tax=Streptomyces sp. NPDC020681 TaxID=3365083 RepID=UPI00379469F5
MSPPGEHGSRAPYAFEGRQIALVDLLDRVLAGGVVITGEVTLCIADIDLVRISLRALIASIRPGMEVAGAGVAEAKALEPPR